MTEKKLNSILYIILAAVVLFYLALNLFAFSGDGSSGMGDGSPGMGDGSPGMDKAEQCSCNGHGVRERTAMEDEEAVWIDSAEDSRLAENDPKGSENPDKEFQEAISSVATEDKQMKEKHEISPSGYHLYVDLDLVLMYVYKNGELVKTYEVSGGKSSSPSPVGTWKIISKDTWGEGFGGAWLGFNVPWGTFRREHM